MDVKAQLKCSSTIMSFFFIYITYNHMNNLGEFFFLAVWAFFFKNLQDFHLIINNFFILMNTIMRKDPTENGMHFHSDLSSRISERDRNKTGPTFPVENNVLTSSLICS